MTTDRDAPRSVGWWGRWVIDRWALGLGPRWLWRHAERGVLKHPGWARYYQERRRVELAAGPVGAALGVDQRAALMARIMADASTVAATPQTEAMRSRWPVAFAAAAAIAACVAVFVVDDAPPTNKPSSPAPQPQGELVTRSSGGALGFKVRCVDVGTGAATASATGVAKGFAAQADALRCREDQALLLGATNRTDAAQAIFIVGLHDDDVVWLAPFASTTSSHALPPGAVDASFGAMAALDGAVTPGARLTVVAVFSPSPLDAARARAIARTPASAALPPGVDRAVVTLEVGPNAASGQ